MFQYVFMAEKTALARLQRQHSHNTIRAGEGGGGGNIKYIKL